MSFKSSLPEVNDTSDCKSQSFYLDFEENPSNKSSRLGLLV